MVFQTIHQSFTILGQPMFFTKQMVSTELFQQRDILLAIGAFAGMLAGLLEIGGGIVIVLIV